MSMRFNILLGLTGLLLASRVAAHDFWIEPASYAPVSGQGVSVRLLVGEHYRGDAVARPPAASLHRFVVADAATGVSATLPGRTGADPVGSFRPPRPGAYVIGFHGFPNPIELPAEKFNAYLADEGLDTVLAQRASNGQLGAPGREVYSRCAKSLVIVDAAAVAGQPVDRELGFELELVAESTVSGLQVGQRLPIRLLYQRRPLAQALVVARRAAAPAEKIELRSDAEGRVWLPLADAGAWMLKSVHMRPAAKDSGAEWDSLWASLSFSVSAAP